MLLFAGKLTKALFDFCRQVSGTLLWLDVSVIKIFNKNPTRRAIKDCGRVPRNLVVAQ